MKRPTHSFHRFYVFFAVLLACLVSAPVLRSQTSDSIANTATIDLAYNTVDSTSYNLYLNNDWKNLSAYCEKAIKQGYDYYYLRLRAGIAYFRLNQFRRAIIHFNAAIKFNSLDDVAPGYLYACYLYTERLEEAKWITRSISPVLAESQRIKDLSPIDFINVENGFKRSDSSRLYRNPLFSSIGLQHSVARRFSLLHTLNYYTQEEARFRVQQFQYYLKGTVPLKHNFLLSVAGHYVNTRAETRKYTEVYTTVNTSYTVPGFPGPPGRPPVTHTIQSSVTYTSIVTTTVTTPKNAYVAGATLLKQTTFFNYSLGFTGSKLDTVTQYQVSAGMAFFPLKNNRLSIGAMAYQHSEDAFKTNEVAVAPFITAYPAKNFFLSVSYFTNTGNNIIESTGYLVNNSIDYTSSRYSVLASHKIFNNAWLYAGYSYEAKKHLVQGFKYNYNMVFIGFKIIPSAI